MTSADERPARLDVGVVGAGRVGAVLGAALQRVGHRVVAVSGVSEGQQLGLFDAARHTRLNAALDAVRARFGDGALDRASAREVKERRRFSGQRYR